ncbi:helix-turn-helix domain-containing protein [Lawsonibacter sp. LCP25S3_G6]|uniref:helix-turn-helix domain-containing protein n=1 Tax=unclassified Lawsonibacter TaxID=2617946 RepID=UPI003F9BFA6B
MDRNTNEYIAIRNRIFQLLDEQKISQKEFAKMIRVSPQTITDWKKGKSQSFSSMLGTIAKALGTSPVWIFAGTGDKEVSWDEIQKKDDERAQLMAAITEQRWEDTKKELIAVVQEAIKRNDWTVFNFVSSELKTFADINNISVEELFGETKKPTVQDDGLSEAEQALIDQFRQLTPEQQDMVIRMVQAAADKQ